MMRPAERNGELVAEPPGGGDRGPGGLAQRCVVGGVPGQQVVEGADLAQSAPAHLAAPSAVRVGEARRGLAHITALSDDRRDSLQPGAGMPWGDLGVRGVWAVAGLAAAGRCFRWE